MTVQLDDVGICLATLLPGPMVCSADDFVGVAEGAASAGATSVSVWTLHTMGMGFDVAAAHLDGVGLWVGAIEAAISRTEGPGEAVAREAEMILDAAAAFGTSRVAAVCVGLTLDTGAATEGLAQFCQLIAVGGVTATIEFLPWSGIPTIAAAADLITRCGEPNAGLLLDTWHWTRQPGGPDVDSLRSIDPERIAYVQLADVAPVAAGELYAETMTDRLLPGEGAVDFTGLFAVLDDMGVDPFVACEVFNAALAAQGPTTATRRMLDACENL